MSPRSGAGAAGNALCCSWSAYIGEGISSDLAAVLLATPLLGPLATAPAALDVVPPGTPMHSAPVDGEPTGVHVPGQPPGGTGGDGPVVLDYKPSKK